ncbi:YcaO-like family protein [Legionella gresilensis]|uniref:YcaO-like family protein n=1 Tax=Legionella gresilensis TaxID=91823 RepID=UPI0010411E82|nr:YcaO-like family protein [Legionella gresilensis]
MTFTNPSLNTSIIKVKHISLQHIHSFSLCGDGMLSTPRSVILNGIISYGGGTGVGLNLICKAFGEYYERNHFFTSVPIVEKKKIGNINSLTHQQHLISLCHFENYQQLLQHQFSFTRLKNIFTQEPYDYLYNAISLRLDKNDSEFLNFSDSCACAAHTSKDEALHNSLIEFLERQALLGSWISKTIRYSINPQILKVTSPYSSLVEKFLDNGDLFIFENGNHLPGYNVIMFYFAHSTHDAVQYSVGSKSSTSLDSALNSAFEELYQCYTFLYNAAFKDSHLENKAGANYHMAFIQYNNQQTRSKIPFFKAMNTFQINNKTDIDNLPQFTYEDMLVELKDLSPNIYYYHFFEETLGLHFTKIVSPDFFAHMALNKSLNLQCLYAKKLKIDPDNAYLESLPFP